MKINQLPVFYFGHLFNELNEHGVSYTHWLVRHGLSEDILKQHAATISSEQFDTLIQHVLLGTKLPHLGLLVGKRMHIAHHGAFGLGILNCRSIRQIVSFVKSYLVTRVPFIEISVFDEQNQLVILANDAHWDGIMHRFVIEAVSMAFANMFLDLQQRHPDITINSWFFDYDEPTYHDKYRLLFDKNVVFNQWFSGLSFDLKWADLPLDDADDLSFEQAKQACEREKQSLNLQLSVAGRVRQCIIESDEKWPNFSDVAARMHTSPRTLHRELRRENTSYKIIIQDCQAKKAREYLLANRYSVNKTAIMLGYSDIANFRRAFKRWYGLSPSQFVEYEDRGRTSNE